MLQAGAHVYVCGDAVSMAGDVHKALLQILEREGAWQEGEEQEAAQHYMDNLEKEGRYQRDVWVTWHFLTKAVYLFICGSHYNTVLGMK